MQIGLFFSTAGDLITEAVDVNKLAEDYAKEFVVSIFKDFYSPASMQEMLTKTKANSLNAVLLIGDSPLAYKSRRSAEFLLENLEELGINPNKIGFVNLKEQLAMVHSGQSDSHTQKARLLIDAEIARVTEAHALDVISIAPRKTVVIIGATTAGFLAAQQLLRKNYTVHMVEKGQLDLNRLFEGAGDLQPVYAYVKSHPDYHFHSGAAVSEFYGYAGDFSLRLDGEGKCVSLAAGAVIVADCNDLDLSRALHPLLHIDIDEDGYFASRNEDTLAVHSSESGVFLIPAGAGQLGFVSAMADSAVLAVIELLDCREIKHKIAISDINTQLCSACGTCVKTCLFHACKIDAVAKVSVIDAQRCKGCGSCVTACPTGARDLLTYPKGYLFKAVDILSQLETDNKKILVFLCEGCGYRALDEAAVKGVEYPVGVLPLRVRCGGTIDTQLILEAFHRGFDGVVICKCQEGHCSNITGNTDLDRRANLFREVLRSRKIDADRMRIVDASQRDSNRCVEAIMELAQGLPEMGVGEDE